MQPQRLDMLVDDCHDMLFRPHCVAWEAWGLDLGRIIGNAKTLFCSFRKEQTLTSTSFGSIATCSSVQTSQEILRQLKLCCHISEATHKPTLSHKSPWSAAHRGECIHWGMLVLPAYTCVAVCCCIVGFLVHCGCCTCVLEDYCPLEAD